MPKDPNPLIGWSQKNPYRKLTDPLWSGPSVLANKIANYIDDPMRAADRGTVRPLIAGGIQGIGDLVSGLTSPLSIGSTGMTHGMKFPLPEIEPRALEATAFHGTRTAPWLGNTATEGTHFGTAQAASERLQYTPRHWMTSNEGPERMFPVKIKSWRPMGSPKDPVTDHTANYVNVKQAGNPDVIFYKNDAEDLGSISYRVMDRGAAVPTGEPLDVSKLYGSRSIRDPLIGYQSNEPSKVSELLNKFYQAPEIVANKFKQLTPKFKQQLPWKQDDQVFELPIDMSPNLKNAYIKFNEEMNKIMSQDYKKFVPNKLSQPFISGLEKHGLDHDTALQYANYYFGKGSNPYLGYDNLSKELLSSMGDKNPEYLGILGKFLGEYADGIR